MPPTRTRVHPDGGPFHTKNGDSAIYCFDFDISYSVRAFVYTHPHAGRVITPHTPASQTNHTVTCVASFPWEIDFLRGYFFSRRKKRTNQPTKKKKKKKKMVYFTKEKNSLFIDKIIVKKRRA